MFPPTRSTPSWRELPAALQVRHASGAPDPCRRDGLAAVEPARASTFVISITPFTEGGAFDEAAIRGHLRRLAAAGIGVYLGGGGSGEGYVLTR